MCGVRCGDDSKQRSSIRISDGRSGSVIMVDALDALLLLVLFITGVVWLWLLSWHVQLTMGNYGAIPAMRQSIHVG